MSNIIGEKKTYEDYGINWMWYLIATINEDETITVHEHFRLHKYDDKNHPTDIAGSFRSEHANNKINGVWLSEPNNINKKKFYYVNGGK